MRHSLRIGSLAVVPALLVLGACATTKHPCFSEQEMFPDKTTACQYGRSYTCDDGDWIAAREACAAPAPKLAATLPPGNCEFGGVSFASGSASCNAGIQYRCDDGRWSSLDRPCHVADTALPTSPNGTGCSYNGSHVSSSSAICQSGTTFLCNNGQWINLGTVCG